MGPVTRRSAAAPLLAALLAGAIMAVGADAAAAFDGFGESSADSTYGEEILFSAMLEGVHDERIEIRALRESASGRQGLNGGKEQVP